MIHRHASAPYPPSQMIAGLAWDDEVVRLGGERAGDNWPLAWGGDELPADPRDRAAWLKGRSTLMVSWSIPPLLLVAMDLSAAEAMEKALANPAAAKPETASVKAVMAKTAMKDWAFRWHFDTEALMKMAMAKLEGEDQSGIRSGKSGRWNCMLSVL